MASQRCTLHMQIGASRAHCSAASDPGLLLPGLPSSSADSAVPEFSADAASESSAASEPSESVRSCSRLCASASSAESASEAVPDWLPDASEASSLSARNVFEPQHYVRAWQSADRYLSPSHCFLDQLRADHDSPFACTCSENNSVTDLAATESVQPCKLSV